MNTLPKTRKDALASGAKWYFSGIPCPQGHISRRKTANGGCYECNVQVTKAWRKRNPVAVQRHQKEAHARDPEDRSRRAREWYAANTERAKVRSAAYQKANLAKYAQANAKRKAKKLHATPVWLTVDDFWVMEEAYKLARLRSIMTGVKWHVDHILPLQGKTVSGLHVPWNLQVIPERDNRRKSNRVLA